MAGDIPKFIGPSLTVSLIAFLVAAILIFVVGFGSGLFGYEPSSFIYPIIAFASFIVAIPVYCIFKGRSR